jgi:Fe2+ transport system protein FeoA
VPEEDAEMLVYLAEQGLVPGAAIVVEEIAPFNGPVSVTVEGARRAISREVAARVQVS